MVRAGTREARTLLALAQTKLLTEDAPQLAIQFAFLALAPPRTYGEFAVPVLSLSLTSASLLWSAARPRK